MKVWDALPDCIVYAHEAALDFEGGRHYTTDLLEQAKQWHDKIDGYFG